MSRVRRLLIWSAATPARYILFWGVLGFGGSFNAISAAVLLGIVLVFGPVFHIPTTTEICKLMGSVFLLGAVWGWLMWRNLMRLRNQKP